VFICGILLGPIAAYLLFRFMITRGWIVLSFGLCAGIWFAAYRIADAIHPSREKPPDTATGWNDRDLPFQR
jgi:hypothetical protein